jgi:hypothetical protein
MKNDKVFQIGKIYRDPDLNIYYIILGKDDDSLEDDFKVFVLNESPYYDVGVEYFAAGGMKDDVLVEEEVGTLLTRLS